MQSFIQKSRAYFFLALFCSLANLVEAQSPVLLKDVNTSLDGTPTYVLTIGNTVFFSAIDPALGRELWKTDGTVAGTVLVKDIASGTSGSSPTEFCNLNGILFFAANGPGGRELWKSDGTPEGTKQVADINPNGASSSPFGMFALGNTVYFKATDGQTGDELWKSDGTPGGTKLVKDINPLAASSQPGAFIGLNNTVFFIANDGTHGRELWKTNGTPAGTVMVKEINLNGNTDPAFLTVFNNALYFNANTLLYKSDGTEAGTIIVPIIDIATGERALGPNSLTVANNTLFFFALSNPTHSQELWKVTTEDVASVVADIRPGPLGSEPRMLTAASGQLFFTADDGIHGRELWKSDGTTAGTVLVQDLVVGVEDAGIEQINVFRAVRGSDLFFSSYGPGGLELRRSDGTVNGVVNLRDIGPTNSNPNEFIKMGNFTYFVADDGKTGRELWKTDNTEAGTQRVADIIPGALGSSPSNLLVVKSVDSEFTLFFEAKNPVKGRELFKLENTANAVPICISDIMVGAGNAGIGNMTAVNGTMHFTAYNGAGSGDRIFKVNPARTAVGIAGGDMISANNLIARGSTLFFTQKGINSAPKLCKIGNGVTTIIKVFDLIPGGEYPIPQGLTIVGTTLFFTAADAEKGRELWKLENTINAVPKRISDIIPGPASSGIGNFTNLLGVLYFTASSAQPSGDRIFKTNATRTSVLPVGGNMIHAANLVAAGGKLFFTQSNQPSGPQLCKLENDTTTVLKTFEVLLDGQSSIPQQLTAVGNKVFFTASDAEHGRELWKSNGSITEPVSDIREGVGNSNILEIRLVGQNLLFSANNRTVGQEPWLLVNAAGLQGDEGDERSEIKQENTAIATVEIKVYPNPASNYINVELPKNDMKGTLSIISASGQLVRSVQSSGGETSLQMDVRDLPKGIYLVRWVQTDDRVVVRKLVVQ